LAFQTEASLNLAQAKKLTEISEVINVWVLQYLKKVLFNWSPHSVD